MISTRKPGIDGKGGRMNQGTLSRATQIKSGEKIATLLPSLDQMRFAREQAEGPFGKDVTRSPADRHFFYTLGLWVDTARIRNYEARQQSIARDMKGWLGDLHELGANIERLIEGNLAVEAGSNTVHWHRRLKRLAAEMLGRKADWYSEALPLGLEMCGFGKTGALVLGQQVKLVWEEMDGDRTIHLHTLDKKVVIGQIRDFERQKARIVDGLANEVDGLGNLEKNLGRLGRNRLKKKAKEYSRNVRERNGKHFAPYWYTTLGDMVDEILGYSASHYEFKLPLAFEFVGYGKEDARALSKMTREIVDKEEAKAHRARNRPVPKKKIFGAFAREFENPEKIMENLLDEQAACRLTKKNVRDSAHGVRGHWLHAARTAYRKSHRKADVWLGKGGMLEWLLDGTGWFDKTGGNPEMLAQILRAVEEATRRETVRNRVESVRRKKGEEERKNGLVRIEESPAAAGANLI